MSKVREEYWFGGGFVLFIVAMFAIYYADRDDALVVSENLSKAADNFEVNRRIVFFNGITDSALLEVVGLCSLEHEGSASQAQDQLEVTCKVGDSEYKKHFLGLSDNVTYFSEHLEASDASAYHYRVTFKPQAIIPDIDLRISTEDGPRSQE